ncbi:MAG: BamA/TamA family outer membrane protein, partial [bacterium]|nr:BamA/TamA family outer membrane protein [bacterium]
SGTTPGLTGGDELSPLSGSFYRKIDSMQSLLPLLKNSAPSLKENLTGTLRIGGMLGGTLQAPSLSANLKAEKLGPQDLTFTVNLDAGLTNPQPPQSLKPSQSLQANLELKELSCASIKTPFDFTGLNATLGLDAPYPLKAQLNLKHIDAGKLLQSLGMGKAGLNGDITGDIDIRGNLEQPDSLLIESRIETARLGSDSFNIENDGPIRITGDANGLNAINMRLKSSGNHLDVSVSGNFPFKSPTATSNPPGLTLSAAADIGLAEKLMDEVSSKGKIVLNATLTGSLSNPRLSAVLRVEDASFAQASMPPLKNLNLHLSADNKSLTLNTLAFNFLENAFNISHPAHIRLTDGNPVLEDFTLTGGENRLHIKGGYAPGTGLDFRVDGSIDNRIIDNMMAEIALYGKNDFSIHLTGTPDKPQISGFIDVRETGFDMRAPDVSLSQLNGRISLEGNAIKFDKLEGNLNDGSLRIGGQFDLFGSPSRKGSISLEVANAKFHFPEGMKSKISTTLYFKPDTDGKSFLLEGNIDLLQGVYEDIPFKLSESYLSLHPVIPDSDIFDKESLTDRLNLNIHLATKTPIWVDKDLAKSEVSFNLTLTGTASHPGITGRCSIKKGGELYFSNRSFFIDKGVVRFNNPEAIEPEIELTALVNIADYDITLKLNGTPENLLPQLSSLPALPEPDIISLLLNGQIKKNIPDQKFDAEAKALTLAGELATGIAKKKIQEFSGIDKVAIDTSLENKEARLTLSDHLTRHIELVLSQSLVDTPKRSYILRFSPSRNISLETEKTDENKYGINFNHYFFFNPSRKSTPQPVTPAGIQPVTPAGIQPVITAGTKAVTPGGLKKTQSNNKKKLIIENITIQPVTPAGAKPVTPAGAKPVTPAETIPVTKAESSGIASFPEKRILGLMKLTKGKHFDYFQFSRDLETIKKFFHHHQYLEVAIRPQRIEKNGSVRLILHISPGPVLLFKYSGANVPVKLRRSIRSLLVAGHFSRPAFSDALLKLKYYYFNKGYYCAKITLPEPQFYGKLKQIRCSIQKGKRFSKPGIQFSGNHSLNSSSLNSLFKNKPLLYSIFTTPEYAVQSIKHLYFKKGFLKTRAQLLPIRFDSKTGKILVNFAISEGPLFKIGAITFEGNRFLHRDQLLNPINLKTGQTFSPEIYKEAAFKLRDLYSKKGFSKCKVESKVEPTSTKELLAIHFMIKENQQGIVKEIAITGNRLTKKHIILRELAFKKGDTIYYRNLNKTRKNLYNLALFDQVDIVLTPLPGQPTASQKRNPANSKPLNTPFPNTPSPNTITKNYKVEIKLREQKRFRLKYGLQLQSTLQDATPVSYGATAQFSDYNLWGRGHYFNLIMGLSNKERKAIGYLGIPYLLGKRIKNELFADYRFKEEPTFTLETVALGLRQKITPWQYTSVSYGYKLSWNKQVGSQEDAPYSYRVGSTGATFSRDSRDNILDAHSGTYHNYSLTLAHNIFGSQVKYIRFSGHYSYYKQLGPVVYAGAVRLGLIKDYGIALPYGERFFAGGGTSIRGYGQNVVGPVDLSGEPAGGNSLFILNQELRFKFSRFFGAVLFMDLGNITPEISDFALGNLRKSIGIGLRIYTPVVLLRLDWGFKLNRRPDESASTIFFSIGQAF